MNFVDSKMDLVDFGVDFVDLGANFVGLGANFLDLEANFVDLEAGFVGLKMDFRDSKMNLVDLETDFVGLGMDFVDSVLREGIWRRVSYPPRAGELTVMARESQKKVTLPTDGAGGDTLATAGQSLILWPGLPHPKLMSLPTRHSP
ncbi:hypothetical protein T459_23351 [Capsicum annuum]|uniref:Uncharacterized protein n=1 Tax=Capsicum annuum TaxID=4072 RepID=A0A2G2YS32_CAPAN|nr:hypothetical protein T459_23351 [Capsicum annuum]